MYRILLLIFVQLLSCGTKESPDMRNGGESYNPGISRFGADTSVFDYDEKISDLKSKLTEDFVILPHSCFVIASNLTRERTNSIIENTISNAEECFYNNYFEKKPDELITIFLFKDDASYRKWAEILYGDTEDLSRFGYYKPSKKAMLMNINTGSGTLVHEMTHAFVRYDFTDIPSWFNEGLGSLYERCSMTDKVILGHVNWRLPELQDALKDGTYSPISALINTDDDSFYGDNSSFNYAQARYLCQYLQDKNLLKKFYKKFRDNFETDKTGKKFLEEVTGIKTGKLDAEFCEWVKELKYEN